MGAREACQRGGHRVTHEGDDLALGGQGSPQTPCAGGGTTMGDWPHTRQPYSSDPTVSADGAGEISMQGGTLPVPAHSMKNDFPPCSTGGNGGENGRVLAKTRSTLGKVLSGILGPSAIHQTVKKAFFSPDVLIFEPIQAPVRLLTGP